MKNIRFVLFILTASCSFYQSTGQEVQNQTGVKVTFENGREIMLDSFMVDNNKYPNLLISAGLYGGTRPIANLDMLFSLQTSFNLNRIGGLSVNLDIPIHSNFDNQYYWYANSFSNKTLNSYKVFSSSEIMIRIPLLDKDYSVNRTVPIKTESAGGVNTIYKTRMRLPTRFSVSSRLGLFSYKSLINNTYKVGEKLRDTEGNILYYQVTDNSTGNITEDIYMTNFFVNSFFIGVETNRINKYNFLVDKTATFKKDKMSFYFDLFIFSKVNMDNMLTRDSITGNMVSHNVYHDNGGFEGYSAGFRFGTELTGFIISQHSGFTVQIEAGRRPGIMNAVSKQSFSDKYFALGRFLYTWGAKL